jgi:hypothetical protein
MNPLSEKSLSLLFDRKVQQGNVKQYMDSLKKEKDEKKFWDKLANSKGPHIKSRMQSIIANLTLRWDLKYAV